MLVPVTEADGVTLDLRYATADNIAQRPIYTRPVALLRPEAYACLRAAVQRAGVLGLRIKLFDAFRPVEAQRILFAAIPDKRYVADPADGGSHGRGAAVDLTLMDAATGAELPMGTGFDAMTELSSHGALDLPVEAIRNRALLLGLMTASGWEHYPAEWWHYHLPDFSALPALSRSAVPDGPM